MPRGDKSSYTNKQKRKAAARKAPTKRRSTRGAVSRLLKKVGIDL